MSSRLQEALQAFDFYNRGDPNQFVWDGEAWPREYFFALRRHEWVLRLDPQAGEALMLSARCQHIGRWEIGRGTYPEGRIGYLSWRKDLMRHHADKAQAILQRIGYEPPLLARVRAIVLKQNIKGDPQAQTMENALCLVFLQYQYEAFHPNNAGKIVDILLKSLRKMDAHGHAHALGLSYSPEGWKNIEAALAILKGEA